MFKEWAIGLPPLWDVIHSRTVSTIADRVSERVIRRRHRVTATRCECFD